MKVLKDVEENIKYSYSLLSERGILGGLYFGIAMFCILFSIPQFYKDENIFPWILLITTVIGVIVSNISYELFMPLIRLISNPIVRLRANNAIKLKERKFNTYDELRTFREEYLNGVENIHFKEKIKNDEKLRQTMTYLASTNIIIFIFLAICCNYFTTDAIIILFIRLTLYFIGLATLVGILARSWSLGFLIGIARNQ